MVTPGAGDVLVQLYMCKENDASAVTFFTPHIFFLLNLEQCGLDAVKPVSAPGS